MDGILSCPSCGRKYPVEEGIPRMIPEGNERTVEETAYQEVENATERKAGEIRKHLEVRQANIAYYDALDNTFDMDVAHAIYLNRFNQQRIASIIQDLSVKSSGYWFLDIGCGTGNVLRFGSNYFQHAVGIDVSINLLKLANKQGMQVIQADVLSLPFSPNIFDVVSAFSVLHHIYDYPLVLKGASRILKKDGFLYTDWDPQKCFDTNSNLVLRAYGDILYVLGRLRLLKSIDEQLWGSEVSRNMPDFRKDHPEFKDLHKLAEYHEQREKEERGLDPIGLKQTLLKVGFRTVDIKGSWHGKSFEELNISFLQRIQLRLKSRLSKQPIDRFMENIMVIAQK